MAVTVVIVANKSTAAFFLGRGHDAFHTTLLDATADTVTVIALLTQCSRNAIRPRLVLFPLKILHLYCHEGYSARRNEDCPGSLLGNRNPVVVVSTDAVGSDKYMNSCPMRRFGIGGLIQPRVHGKPCRYTRYKYLLIGNEAKALTQWGDNRCPHPCNFQFAFVHFGVELRMQYEILQWLRYRHQLLLVPRLGYPRCILQCCIHASIGIAKCHPRKRQRCQYHRLGRRVDIVLRKILHFGNQCPYQSTRCC
mmetsp:Transcript_5301/g.12030  ORF Transcript_5301/g.12030 Transcript_5301/m.12030 type:complete len:251 (-) Transcript_5301:426-1178(-)